MTPNYRALCAELADNLELILNYFHSDECGTSDSEELIARTRATLAAEPQGPTDEQIVEWSNERAESTRNGETEDWWVFNIAMNDDLVGVVRAALARWVSTTPRPTPVTERLPWAWECLKRGNSDWCWGQERSLLTGLASAQWRLMRVGSLADEAVSWLPAQALPLPEKQ
jgi:hypothetical protein